MHYQTASKIVDREHLIRKVNAWRVRNSRIVFTNGCFDLLHAGHIDYLERASHLGDKLIVALNADASVRALKGASRPIVAQDARARILAALHFVDAVVIFEEATPLALISAVAPDFLVKGDDYAPEVIAGYEVVTARGGEVVTLPLVDGYSTSKLVERVKNG